MQDDEDVTYNIIIGVKKIRDILKIVNLELLSTQEIIKDYDIDDMIEGLSDLAPCNGKGARLILDLMSLLQSLRRKANE